MPPSAAISVLPSPSELAYLHSSLSLSPPIRPDGRSPTQFRTLIAETDILPTANGSARVCFADGSEAIVGVKAEVAKTGDGKTLDLEQQVVDDEGEGKGGAGGRKGESSWIEMSLDIPGYREDDALPVFVASMLTEPLLAGGGLKERLWISRRHHWKLYIDVLLLSQPLSYPLPLLSFTTHLALLSARLPSLISEGDEDPMFDDDWEASGYLYPYDPRGNRIERPAITLLIVSIGKNLFFDPTKEEISVADNIIAVSVGYTSPKRTLQILSLRLIDPPSRVTNPGIPNSINASVSGNKATLQETILARESSDNSGVWNPPRGGLPRSLVPKIMTAVLGSGSRGIVQEVFDGLDKMAAVAT
jgi:exosome complex component RRP42